MTATPEEVEAGHAAYTKRTLNVYDLAVLGISNRFIWKCPTRRLLDHYNSHVSSNHLDVGVGTGYFLDHCRFPTEMPRVGLMDLNVQALQFASERIARYHPKTYRHNVLEAGRWDEAKFDSVGANYLLHCVPGSIKTKAVAFDHLQEIMNPGGVLFGSTILQGGVRSSWLAKRLMGAYNTRGIFSNREDTFEKLESELRSRFGSVSLEVIGCVALFACRE